MYTSYRSLLQHKNKLFTPSMRKTISVSKKKNENQGCGIKKEEKRNQCLYNLTPATASGEFEEPLKYSPFPSNCL